MEFYLLTAEANQLRDMMRGIHALHHPTRKTDTPYHQTARQLLKYYQRRINELEQELQQVQAAFSKCGRHDTQEVLKRRFLQRQTVEQVADEMNYSIGNIFRLSKIGLEEIADYLPKQI